MSLPLILNQKHYIHDLIEQINNPLTTEAWVQAMVFSPRNQELHLLMEALHGLVQRGGSARIITDYYNFLRPEDYHLADHKDDPFYVQEVKNIITAYRNTRDEFIKAGGVWIETNNNVIITKILDIWNRNHMKSAGIIRKDDTKSIYLGGCNIYPQAMEYIDFMVRFDEAIIFDKVKEVVDAIAKGKNISDMKIPCTEDFTVYVDGATFPGKSIIMETAFQMLQENDIKNVYLMSQLPTDPLLQWKLESLAKKGTNIHIFLPPPDKTDIFVHGVGKWLYERMLRAKQRYSNYHLYLSTERKVHAKLLLTERSSGENKAFWGSNNFFMLGPLLKTNEIQMLSTDHELNSRLKDAFWGMVQGATEAAPG